MAGSPVLQDHSRRDLQGIQFLRAIAVLLVVANHSMLIMQGEEYFGRSLLPDGMAEKGAIGVDLFFVVSGFIIAYVSLAQGTLKSKLGIGDFAVKRFVRIVPFLWFAVILYAAIRFVTIQDFDLGPFLNAMFVLPVGEQRPNVVWTLRHELLFYTLFAISFLLRRRVPWLVYGWAVLPVVAWPVFAILRVEPENDLAQFLLSPSNFNFAVGLTIGLAYLRVSAMRRLSLPLTVAWPLIALTVAALVAARNVLPTGVTAVVAGVIVLVALTMPARNDPVSRFLEMLGNASYSIYLTHNIAILLGLEAWVRILGAKYDLVAFALVVVAATAFGVGLHFAVEKPLIRAANRLVKARRRTAVTPAEPARA